MYKPFGMRGFTLVELMIVIALLAIVATLAVPNFVQFIRNNQVQAKAEEVVSFLQYARSQAVVGRSVHEIDLSDNTEWSVNKSGSEADRLLAFSTVQAVARHTALTGDKLVFRANGAAREAVRITICRDDDFANGYLIEVRPGGSVQMHGRGRKSDTEKMTTCTPT